MQQLPSDFLFLSKAVYRCIAVHQVTDKRKPGIREMRSDLMHPAGMQIYLQQTEWSQGRMQKVITASGDRQ